MKTIDHLLLGRYLLACCGAPHNRFWTQNLVEYVAYEERLHQKFETLLDAAQPDKLPYREYVPLHQAYCREVPSMENDFRYILTACVSLMEKYLFPVAEAWTAEYRLHPAGGPAA